MRSRLHRGLDWRCGCLSGLFAGELARSAGLRVVEDTPLAALLGRLLPGLDLGADAGAEYKLCVLSKAPSTRES